MGTVLQCCGFLERRTGAFNTKRRESRWDVFDHPLKHRRESAWDVLDTNLFSHLLERSGTCDMSPEINDSTNVTKKDVSFTADQTNNGMESKIASKQDYQDTIIQEMMSLIDRTDTGVVEFPEFIETITVKILQDAVSAGFRGN